MADEKKSLMQNDTIFIYAALKHLPTAKNQNKMKISKTLQVKNQRMGIKQTSCAKTPPAQEYPRASALHHPNSFNLTMSIMMASFHSEQKEQTKKKNVLDVMGMRGLV